MSLNLLDDIPKMELPRIFPWVNISMGVSRPYCRILRSARRRSRRVTRVRLAQAQKDEDGTRYPSENGQG